MRIAVITSGISANESEHSGAAAITNLIRQLSEFKDLELVIFSFYYPLNQPEYLLFNSKVFSFGKPHKLSKVDKIIIWKDCIRAFGREHAVKPFDLVHSMWSGEPGYIASSLSRKHKIPLVTNINGGELGELKDIGFGSRVKVFQKYFVGRAFSGAGAIVSGSDFISELVKSHYDENVFHKVRKTPFGVDEKMFFPSAGDHGNRSHVLISIANAIPVKSHITLFRALRIATDTFNGLKLECYGHNENRHLEDLAVETGISDNVKIMGYAEYDTIPQHLNKAGIFVHSSLYESQNMSILEAAFCGLPIISTDVGIAREITKHIVKPGNFEQLAEKINFVISNYAAEKKKAVEKVNEIKTKFSLAASAKSFYDLYTELISGKQ